MLNTNTQTDLALLKQTELNGQAFQIYGTADEPLFKAKDIAEWLGNSNTTDMVKKVDAEELTKLNLGSRQGESWFLTEYGLYEVLMQSRKPIAKQFKRGIKAVLKEIRQTGNYLGNQKYIPIEEVEAEVEQRVQELFLKKEKIIEVSNFLEKKYGERKLNRYKKLKSLGLSIAGASKAIIHENYQGLNFTKKKMFTCLDTQGRPFTLLQRVWTEDGRKFVEAFLLKLKNKGISFNDYASIAKIAEEMGGK